MRRRCMVPHAGLQRFRTALRDLQSPRPRVKRSCSTREGLLTAPSLCKLSACPPPGSEADHRLSKGRHVGGEGRRRHPPPAQAAREAAAVAAAAACGAQARATTGQPIWTCPTTRTRSRDRWTGAIREHSELAQLLLMAGLGCPLSNRPEAVPPALPPPTAAPQPQPATTQAAGGYRGATASRVAAATGQMAGPSAVPVLCVARLPPQPCLAVLMCFGAAKGQTLRASPPP